MAGTRNILILGGGASGTLLAIHLLRGGSDSKVTLIERAGALGKGIAYGSASPIHLLNVRASNMSAYPDIPEHFVRWLEENDDKDERLTDDFRFASRLAFGNYLTDQLQQLGTATGRLVHIQGEAVSLSRAPNGIVVTLDNFRRVSGDLAVIATGYESPAVADISLKAMPWLGVDRAAMKNLESILLLGTGLSMVDHVQSLLAAGYEGQIFAISRRGLLPQSHRPVEPMNIAAGDVPFGQSLKQVFRWFRQRVRHAEQTGADWRAVLDGLRPYVQELWQSLSISDQSRFVRHARPWWDVRRHRMAPKVAAAIDGLRASRRLTIVAAKIASVRPRDDLPSTLEVRYRRRGKSTIQTIDVQAITDCTGFSIDISKAKNPLVRNLLDQGIARPDRLGLGFEVDRTANLIDRNGEPARDIFAVGPLTRGAFWEITGIPDIRSQCAELAARLTHTTPDAQVVKTSRAASQ